MDEYIQVLAELEIQQLTDAVLVLDDGQKIPVHRVVLAKKSTFFRSLFTHEADKEEYKVGSPGWTVSTSAFLTMLASFHTHSLALTEENIEDVTQWGQTTSCVVARLSANAANS